ncbi:MAG: hypothetical protein K6F68_00445 [Clostridiales bacterium]|nr:hypothetical protein [Clostridiales bacterium]
MIDIHCHIVPGVDDGSGDFAESTRMGEIAEASGVTDIIVTPHCNIPGSFGNYFGPWYEREFEGLSSLFERNGVHVNLHRGMEVFGTDDVARLYDDGLVLTLAGSDYMLVEFDFGDDMWRVRDVLFSLFERKITPVIAHPERYYPVQDDPGFALDWARMGCLLQINRTSLLSHRSDPCYRTARTLLDEAAVHFIATDSHGVFTRTTELADAYEFVAERYSEEWADLLTNENPRRVIENRRVRNLPLIGRN